MNFDEAIKAHAAWKMKLQTYLSHPDHSLDPAVIECDNRCDLGKWIYGEGAKHNKLTEYADLRSEHAKFHKAAAAIVRKADSGQSVSEEVALGSKSAFGMTSSAVVTAIMKMRSKSS